LEDFIPCPAAFFNAIPAAVPTAPSAAAIATAGASAAINAGIAARSGNIPPDLAMSLMAAAERLSLTPLFDFVLH
jgi:hypothetical protein